MAATNGVEVVDAHDDPFATPVGGWSREDRLRDGTPVLLRQVRPEDRDRLAAAVAALSPASRYLRFHSVADRLDDAQLTYLTEVDHVDHEAIVALDRDHPERPGIGVARYVREPYETHVAEAAVTVADAYHGRGAGTLLLGALAARARAEGVTVFRSYVLDGNAAMLEVFDHLGADRRHQTDGLWRVDLDVPDADDELPRSGAGRAFREAATGRRRLVSLLPPVWSRREHPTADLGEATEAAGTLTEDGAELAEVRRELDAWLARPDRR